MLYWHPHPAATAIRDFPISGPPIYIERLAGRVQFPSFLFFGDPGGSLPPRLRTISGRISRVVRLLLHR
jgi:hypothetical protein